MNSIISCKNIYKSFSNIEVLKGIDLNIKKGEIVSIVGPSGSGKTTLLHILGTLENPDPERKPELIIDSQSVMKLNDNQKAILRNKKLGFVFQFHELLPEFTAIENICMPSWISKKNEESIKEDAMNILSELDLLKMANKKPDEMSGGERQRVSVARSLMNSPKIVFADEPSGNLDSENSKTLYNLFYEVRKKIGCSFLIVTHDLKIANINADWDTNIVFKTSHENTIGLYSLKNVISKYEKYLVSEDHPKLQSDQMWPVNVADFFIILPMNIISFLTHFDSSHLNR